MSEIEGMLTKAAEGMQTVLLLGGEQPRSQLTVLVPMTPMATSLMRWTLLDFDKVLELGYVTKVLMRLIDLHEIGFRRMWSKHRHL